MNITKKKQRRKEIIEKFVLKNFAGLVSLSIMKRYNEQDDLNMCEYSKWRNCGYNS